MHVRKCGGLVYKPNKNLSDMCENHRESRNPMELCLVLAPKVLGPVFHACTQESCECSPISLIRVPKDMHEMIP
jgi:hypothetical protein